MDILHAHDFCDCNVESIRQSDRLGCFCCKTIWAPAATPIKEWIDHETTALCPHCGVDSVLAEKDVHITKEFLEEMNEYWFNEE